MVNLRTELNKDIAHALKEAASSGAFELSEEIPSGFVKRTEDATHGHYASPIALSLAKQLKQKPIDIAHAIVSHMPVREYIAKVEVAAPGFVNIYIDREFLASRMDDVHDDDLCSGCNVGASHTVNLEFISANPTGPLTLGNARTAFSADTLGNVMQCAGYNVIREYYINDAGEQIGRLGQSVLRRILQQEGHDVEFPEDLYQGEYIGDIAREIAEEYKEKEGKKFLLADLEDTVLLSAISQKAMRACLAKIQRTIQHDLHISFDVWSSEQAVKDSGEIEKVLAMLEEKRLMYVKDGAKFLKTTEFGDSQDRVMVKKNGAYAYITPDVAYHQGKFDRKFDLIFTFMGADHQGHVPKLTAALAALGNDTSKLKLVLAQFLSVVRSGEQVSLSKRRGNVYSPQELIQEIGYDAARFFMVQHALTAHMVLDIDIAKEKSERNPVYYVQYAYVRLASIIRKAKGQGVLLPGDVPQEVTSRVTITHDTEEALALEIFRLSEVVEDIATTYAVHQLPLYAYDLARQVSAFYRDVPVLSEKDPMVQKSRLQMAVAAHRVLGKVLDLLGIGKPDVM
jgi:arginyl-tRNA synthetase